MLNQLHLSNYSPQILHPKHPNYQDLRSQFKTWTGSMSDLLQRVR